MEKVDSKPAQPATPSSEDARSEHLGFVAHEVRNPLSTALWSAELLGRLTPEERGGARGEKLSAMCLRSIGRVRQLVEDHLLCERLDARGIAVHPEPIPLRELLEELAGRRSLELTAPEIDVPAELSVLADKTLLDRALDALLAAAGYEGAVVRISAREEAGAVRIRVAGAAPAVGALEDPKKGTQADPRGRSLSLPVARRIAAVLGGTLALDGGAFVLGVPDKSHAPTRASLDSPGADR
jgi:K+-sensing histidine kinase KdpD